ncbi:MAG: Gfo/Idh/MocA family oxidoreductase [Fibrobacteres bacterium]|nr:Gfo/Idh/MocA family oxidoreductase [Fibrobacterota bacterium]
MVKRKTLRFGIIGLGLMGKEFASSVARWCHLNTSAPIPVLTAVCDTNPAALEWFKENVPSIKVAVSDHKELLKSSEVDAVYCAIPHSLHENMYIDILKAGKHLLGEKPFGIDKKANDAIMNVINNNPNLIVRCSSEFPYFPACKRLIEWIKAGSYGRLIEVRSGFHHSSDMDQTKPINWKRISSINGEYGCMGDLGMHTQHVPFRMGWKPISVYADLQKLVKTRPDGKGNTVPCDTWDNALLICKAIDPRNKEEFSIHFETRRMAPGATNTWYLEVYGTEGSARFTTADPKAFYVLETKGKEQGWTRFDTGSQSFVPSVTGGIFEFGFSDALQQMIAAFCEEFAEGGSKHQFGNVTPEETAASHALLTAALLSNKEKREIKLS